MTNVLIIDDDANRLHNVSRIVEAEGLSVTKADSAAPHTVPDRAPDIVLLATTPANENYFEGRHIFPRHHASHSEPVIVIAGSHASPEDVAAGVRSAVRALRLRNNGHDESTVSAQASGNASGYGSTNSAAATGASAAGESPHAPARTAGSPPGNAPLSFLPGTPLAEVERDMILATLARNSGARNKTAMQLGISQKTLYNKLKQFETRAEIDARITPVATESSGQ